jgi:hypothetical protein
MSHYGYNLNSIGHAESFRNVSPEQIEKVKSLETGMIGIGWPLKALFTYVLFIPYLFIIYLLGFIIDTLIKRNIRKQ